MSENKIKVSEKEPHVDNYRAINSTGATQHKSANHNDAVHNFGSSLANQEPVTTKASDFSSSLEIKELGY